MPLNTTKREVDARNVDAVVLLDMSRSMTFPDAGESGSRWERGEKSITRVARDLQQYDDDGITVVPFNDNYRVVDGVNGDTVSSIFRNNTPDNGTLLAPPLRAVIEKFLPARKKASGGFTLFGRRFGGSTSDEYERVSPRKPVCIMIYTDGAPQDQDEIAKVIVDATKRIKYDGDLGILFIQVGQERGVAHFLERLDTELRDEGADFDVVAVTNLKSVGLKSTLDLINMAYEDNS